MRWFDRFFTRHDHRACFAPVPDPMWSRLRAVCEELGEDERQAQARLGLRVRPRLSLVDEEMGRLIRPRQRDAIGRKDATS